jgi:hypothetical protein
MERKNLSTVLGIQLTMRTPHENEINDIANNSLILVRRDNGQRVAVVDRDDLFDADGNRFYSDV